MAALGFPSLITQTVFGIHDYQQYYADIYRKAFIHANKHTDRIGDFIPMWKAQSPQDCDYLIALRGFYDGLMSLTEARIDRRDYIKFERRALEELGLQEKSAPKVGQIDFLFVESVLEQAGTTPLNTSITRTRIQQLKDFYYRLHLFRLIPYLFGVILIKVGRRLKSSVT